MTYTFSIPGRPITKKNHQQIRRRASGTPFIAQSETYLQYERDAGWFLKPLMVAAPVNVQCIYYMPTRQRVDLCNLLAATCDILVKHNVLVDDNYQIVVSHDGSRVEYDKSNPRTEIVITPKST